MLQSSANLSGEPDARTPREVPRELRDGVDLVLDGGELPGVRVHGARPARLSSASGRWTVACGRGRARARREAVSRDALASRSVLASCELPRLALEVEATTGER